MIDVVQKLWGFCHTLRHDGVGYTEYIEQITYLLFLKMADEKGIDLPKGCTWTDLSAKSGTDLIDTYPDMLRTLGKQEGILGQIFAGAQPRITKPASFKQLITSFDTVDWTSQSVDIKAEAYEGLLEKAASEGKKGAGGYFTPRPLIRSIVRCMKPDPREHKEFKICDPACGVGGFLVAANDWLHKQDNVGLTRPQATRIKKTTYYGQDISEQPRRLALMNLYLHQVEPNIALGDSIYDPPKETNCFDVVLTNPPFGTRGAGQAPTRDDFTIQTSNKQLNFVQHVMTILRPGGRAAVVLPDNCLFADQAGQIIEILTKDCDLHTLLRLPHGTFTPYCQGVKANVIFFT
ncbi:MAG: SAM-dependent DNA methyltransferase, partial [Planctomycetes bacterium]|nr:SAM-dependent DNA methyltransferase [Planctomycetota bacterium]